MAQNRTVNWMFLWPYQQTWAESYDFHPQCGDVTTDRGAARGHTNSPHSTNLEFHCRYLSHIRGRDGVMASRSIRPSALKGRWEATACSRHASRMQARGHFSETLRLRYRSSFGCQARDVGLGGRSGESRKCCCAPYQKAVEQENEARAWCGQLTACSARCGIVADCGSSGSVRRGGLAEMIDTIRTASS